ncbi:MAG: hypothetical protein ACYTE5_12075, partial [Planctomycetota bacterium]
GRCRGWAIGSSTAAGTISASPAHLPTSGSNLTSSGGGFDSSGGSRTAAGPLEVLGSCIASSPWRLVMTPHVAGLYELLTHHLHAGCNAGSAGTVHRPRSCSPRYRAALPPQPRPPVLS